MIRQSFSKTEALCYLPPDEVALDGTAYARSDIGGVTVPDRGIEQDHRTGLSGRKNLARVLRPGVGNYIAWSIGPVMRSRNEACRSVVLPEGIDHENESE